MHDLDLDDDDDDEGPALFFLSVLVGPSQDDSGGSRGTILSPTNTVGCRNS